MISLGFVLALWSGSRALHVFIDTITIMHGLGGHRGIVKTRALSFALYLLAMVTGVITLPLVIAGPEPGTRTGCPERADFLIAFYWPIVIVLCICFLATLYHVSVPVRTHWSFNLPGATFTLFCWIVGSYLLRWFLTATAADSKSIYGPLAAPDRGAAVALPACRSPCSSAAAVNAAFDEVFPQKATTRARLELMRRLRRIGAREDADDACRPARDRLPPVADDSSDITQDRVPGNVPCPTPSLPWWKLGRRLLLADRDPARSRRYRLPRPPAYRDANDPPLYGVDLVDSIYYTTVTLSTTGYGDIAPVSGTPG